MWGLTGLQNQPGSGECTSALKDVILWHLFHGDLPLAPKNSLPCMRDFLEG
jgi:hypothetical protein